MNSLRLHGIQITQDMFLSVGSFFFFFTEVEKEGKNGNILKLFWKTTHFRGKCGQPVVSTVTHNSLLNTGQSAAVTSRNAAHWRGKYRAQPEWQASQGPQRRRGSSARLAGVHILCHGGAGERRWWIMQPQLLAGPSVCGHKVTARFCIVPMKKCRSKPRKTRILFNLNDLSCS